MLLGHIFRCISCVVHPSSFTQHGKLEINFWLCGIHMFTAAGFLRNPKSKDGKIHNIWYLKVEVDEINRC